MDFMKLTFSLVEAEKELRSDFRKKRCLVSHSRIIRVSSASYRIGKSLLLFNGIGSFKRLISFILLTRDCKRSTAKTKSKRETGSPCMTPLLQWIVFPGTPFNKTTRVLEESIYSI